MKCLLFQLACEQSKVRNDVTSTVDIRIFVRDYGDNFRLASDGPGNWSLAHSGSRVMANSSHLKINRLRYLAKFRTMRDTRAIDAFHWWARFDKCARSMGCDRVILGEFMISPNESSEQLVGRMIAVFCDQVQRLRENHELFDAVELMGPAVAGLQQYDERPFACTNSFYERHVKRPALPALTELLTANRLTSEQTSTAAALAAVVSDVAVKRCADAVSQRRRANNDDDNDGTDTSEAYGEDVASM